VIKIKGTASLRRDLRAELVNAAAKFFTCEEEPMYTKRESELLQMYVQQHGRLPGAAGELDDLF
jgi:phage gpG-like protein